VLYWAWWGSGSGSRLAVIHAQLHKKQLDSRSNM
jgi:hypothetical protein